MVIDFFFLSFTLSLILIWLKLHLTSGVLKECLSYGDKFRKTNRKNFPKTII